MKQRCVGTLIFEQLNYEILSREQLYNLVAYCSEKVSLGSSYDEFSLRFVLFYLFIYLFVFLFFYFYIFIYFSFFIFLFSVFDTVQQLHALSASFQKVFEEFGFTPDNDE
jgi:hypothetical protein